MNIINEIKNILKTNRCSCFYFDEMTLTLKHNLSLEEGRENVCNHVVFTSITGLLLKHNINFEITSNNDIIIQNNTKNL